MKASNSPMRTLLDLLYSQTVRVDGDSMAPTLPHRQMTVVVPPREIKRGDVVILVRPAPPWDKIIKRVVGLPDESVLMHEGLLYVDDVLTDSGSSRPAPTERSTVAGGTGRTSTSFSATTRSTAQTAEPSVP